MQCQSERITRDMSTNHGLQNQIRTAKVRESQELCQQSMVAKTSNPTQKWRTGTADEVLRWCNDCFILVLTASGVSIHVDLLFLFLAMSDPHGYLQHPGANSSKHEWQVHAAVFQCMSLWHLPTWFWLILIIPPSICMVRSLFLFEFCWRAL